MAEFLINSDTVLNKLLKSLLKTYYCLCGNLFVFYKILNWRLEHSLLKITILYNLKSNQTKQQLSCWLNLYMKFQNEPCSFRIIRIQCQASVHLGSN